MKKHYILLLTLLISISSFGQTTIDFDDSGDWTYSSGYGSHTYSKGGFSFVSSELYRETTGTQDGVAKALGTYAIRLRNNGSSEVTFNVATGGVEEFVVSVRRWDGSPSPDFALEYSTNGGTDWTSVATINNASLNNSSDWSTFGATISSNVANIKIRFKSNGSTERIMIDDFVWTEFGSSVVLSTKDIQIEGFNVYPNPVVNGSFQITTASNADKQVNIYNMIGKQVYSKNVRANETVEVSNLTTGIYFVNVEEEGKTATKKLVIK